MPKPSQKEKVTARNTLARLLSSKPTYRPFEFWIIGLSPLICHAWSEKAKRAMLVKQVKASKTGRDAKDPERDFLESLYPMGKEGDRQYFGFPALAVKNSIMDSAHKDKGIPKTTVMAALWVDGELIRVKTAFPGARCDLPLVRVYGSDPEMREDMVRVGAIKKTANLSYRAQFTTWALKIRGHFNPNALSEEQLQFLVGEGGMGYGIGDWRNEKRGMFGSYRLAYDDAEVDAWEAFAAGAGPLPQPQLLLMAAE